jgi:hypothetical protein
MALINSSTPSTAIPSRRKGSNSIQKIGYKTIARRARGQHNTKRISQRINEIISIV